MGTLVDGTTDRFVGDHGLHLEITREGPITSQAYWKARIHCAWMEKRHRQLKICEVTAEARRHLARGEWSRMFREDAGSNHETHQKHERKMPFSKTEGAMRVRIWRAVGGLNEQDLGRLPDKLTTLDVLARLNAPTIRRCIAEGLIHSRLKKDEAAILVGRLIGSRTRSRRRTWCAGRGCFASPLLQHCQRCLRRSAAQSHRRSMICGN